MSEHPPCMICERQVRKREGEGNKNWLRRRTCSPECRNQLHSDIHTGRPRGHYKPKRFCQAPGCSNPILRREAETASNFNRRRTCCVECEQKLGIVTNAVIRERMSDSDWPEITGEQLPDKCFAGMDVQKVAGGRLGLSMTHVRREATS